MSKKTIAVLTSGGDAPGMNAAIRAIVRSGISAKMRVLGVKQGYNGLINSDFIELNLRSVSDIIHCGGTILYTARSPEFFMPSGILKAKENCEKAGIDSVIVIGGDGSFKGARELSLAGIPCIGIPATIDNDIGCSEYTIGFDTAVNTAMEMTDKLRDTAQSHHRCSVVEVMGRHCGQIALKAGIAVGATAIVVPEVPFDFNKDILERLIFTQKMGKKHFIIIVAEGVGKIEDIAEKIFTKTGIDTRTSTLGHVQRGGSPSLTDRVFASEMGRHAIKLLEQNIENRIIAMHCNKVVDYDINEAIKMKKPFDLNLYKTALDLSI